MMSYLEGDSLLRDIQKSLGNEELEEEDEDDDEEFDREIDADGLIGGVVTDTDIEGRRETSFKNEPTSGKNKS